MTSYFCGKNKQLYGFSISYKGEIKDDITSVKASVVKKIIDHALETNMEIHVLTNISIPCIFIKTPQAIWHYVRSRDEADEFRKNIVISDHYPCCQYL